MPVLTLWCCWLATALPFGAAAAQEPSATDRAHAVAAVWAGARYNFAYWDRVRADWDSALAASLRLTAAPQRDIVFYRRLRRFLALLEDGQAEVTPPSGLRSRIARPPLLLRSVERRPFILDYADNDEMRVARPERLAEILSVQGLPAENWIRDSVLPEISASTAESRWQRAVARMLEGEKGTPLLLRLRIPGGETRGLSVTRSVSSNERWLDPRPVEVDTLPDGIVWVRLNALALAEVVKQFDRALPDFVAVKGLIIDLRENGGGGGGGGRSQYGYQILARLTDQPFLSARWRAPLYRPVFGAWDLPDSTFSWYGPPPDTVPPRQDRPAFTGPVAVLASPRTAAAAEEFLVAFRAAGRGPIIGETSAGTAGDALTLPLPRGGSFRLCAQRKMFPDGTEFVGVGIGPDIPVVVKVSDLLAGRDEALEQARAYLAERLGQPSN